MQELWNTMKKVNLLIKVMNEVKESQVNCIDQVLNMIKEEKHVFRHRKHTEYQTEKTKTNKQTNPITCYT